jgi:hypothetical protein
MARQLDLAECERRVGRLEACPHPLTVWQRAEASTLESRLCNATSQTPEQRERALGLALRLGILLAREG